MQADCAQRCDLLTDGGEFRVLLAVTGSVAALRTPALAAALRALPGVSRGLLEGSSAELAPPPRNKMKINTGQT